MCSINVLHHAGGLQFDPETVTISKGDSVTWQNNAGFPHNIVFDEDGVPVSPSQHVQETCFDHHAA